MKSFAIGDALKCSLGCGGKVAVLALVHIGFWSLEESRGLSSQSTEGKCVLTLWAESRGKIGFLVSLGVESGALGAQIGGASIGIPGAKIGSASIGVLGAKIGGASIGILVSRCMAHQLGFCRVVGLHGCRCNTWFHAGQCCGVQHAVVAAGCM